MPLFVCCCFVVVFGGLGVGGVFLGGVSLCAELCGVVDGEAPTERKLGGGQR
jgi:hypothetical protein